MNTLNESQLSQIEGGNVALVSMAIGAYMNLLNKIEQNPGGYTWTMDWYYMQ